MIERAEFPVQRNKTLYGFLYVSLPMLISSGFDLSLLGAQPLVVLRTAVLKIAELGMAIAAIRHKKADQGANSFDVGAINY